MNGAGWYAVITALLMVLAYQTGKESMKSRINKSLKTLANAGVDLNAFIARGNEVDGTHGDIDS